VRILWEKRGRDVEGREGKRKKGRKKEEKNPHGAVIKFVLPLALL